MGKVSAIVYLLECLGCNLILTVLCLSANYFKSHKTATLAPLAFVAKACEVHLRICLGHNDI